MKNPTVSYTASHGPHLFWTILEGDTGAPGTQSVRETDYSSLCHDRICLSFPGKDPVTPGGWAKSIALSWHVTGMPTLSITDSDER